ALKRLYIFDIGGPHTYREVFMDGRSHPADLIPTNYGHNIGWWDGDVLVIENPEVHLHPKAQQDIGMLLAKLDEGYDVVSGWRKDRQDARIQTHIRQQCRQQRDSPRISGRASARRDRRHISPGAVRAPPRPRPCRPPRFVPSRHDQCRKPAGSGKPHRICALLAGDEDARTLLHRLVPDQIVVQALRVGPLELKRVTRSSLRPAVL
ncbi:MAG: hypothetical protein HC777_02505, partial [Hyphomonadaceae bacterium]|nr:hypothetical protein [Hyphomonadaceae bacterium]